MDPITADKPCLPDEPATTRGSNARLPAMRWIALAAVVMSAAIAAWIWWGPRSITEEYIPLLLLGAFVGFGAAVIAALNLRAASTPVRIGQILIGLGGLALGGWNLFLAWMVAIFPKC